MQRPDESETHIAEVLPFAGKRVAQCHGIRLPLLGFSKTPLLWYSLHCMKRIDKIGGFLVHTLLSEVCAGSAVCVAVLLLPCL